MHSPLYVVTSHQGWYIPVQYSGVVLGFCLVDRAWLGYLGSWGCAVQLLFVCCWWFADDQLRTDD